MEFKGTKAPWKSKNLFNNWIVVYEKDGEEFVLEIRDSKANAQLISCSLEMLEMLQYFVKENMLSITGEEMAIELIKKATEI